jgi:hypothetical protein
MERLNIGKCTLLAIAVVFVLTGDYVAFLGHVRTIV